MNLLELDRDLRDCGGVQWLINHGVFSKEKECLNCGKRMYLSFNKISYRCSNKKCRKEISMKKNTVFGKTKLKLEKVIMLMYSFVYGYSTKSIERELKISRSTIAKFKKIFRKLLSVIINEQNQNMIGGDNHIVQIDEMYIGRRKYGRGRSPAEENQHWYVGGIDTTTKEIFYEMVNNRDNKTLFDVIHRYVRLDSIIYTDSWRGYNSIDEDYEHYTINHKEGFVNDNVHTQNIEATHNAVRRILRRNGTNSGNKELQFMEYIWIKHQNGNSDLFENFINDLAYLYN